MACSRTCNRTPGSMGSMTISPGASREKATRPGPVATLNTKGIPARIRLAPPGMPITDIAVCSSFQSITWCSKNAVSPSPRLTSAIGTTAPSSW